MKKNGFTLAEVLITLAIIGVVATLTLPALMTNTQEQQAKTALKKGINTLTEAAQMHQAITGVDFGSISSANTTNSEDDEQSLYRLLAERTQMDLRKSADADPTNMKMGQASTQGNFVVFFRDGSALSFNPNLTRTTDANQHAVGGTVGSTQPDGLPYGIAAIYDTNGTKGPNVLSNCQRNTTQAFATEYKANASTACNTKTNRVIKDQFGVRLRGGFAVPNGEAARWAFEN